MKTAGMTSYEHLAQQMGQRIKTEMHNQDISQSVLANRLGKSQAFVSNLLHGKSNVSMKDMFAAMEALGMDPLAEIADCSRTHAAPPAPMPDIFAGAFVTNPQSPEFYGQTGTFHTYFLSTNRYEDHWVKGILHLKEREQRCIAEMELSADRDADQEKPTIKTYNGFAAVSPQQHAVYILLVNKAIGEMCFLSYPHNPIMTEKRRLECTMAVVATVSSGIDSRTPTVHRMMLSRRELNDAELQQLYGQVLLNHSQIRISRSKFVELCTQKKISAEFMNHFLHCAKEQTYYEIEEGGLKALERISGTYFHDLCTIRGNSTAAKNNKINQGTISDIYYMMIRKDS